MDNAFDEILDRAKDNVLDGEHDAGEAIRDAFDIEATRSWVLWDLMKEVFNPDDVLNGDFGDEDPYIQLFDRVVNEISDEVEDFIEEHTWTVHYCDGPTVNDEYDSDELTTEDEFLDTIEELTSEEGGWTVVERDDREVWLYDGYEGMED